MLATIKLASVALAAGASLTGTAPAMASTLPHQAPQPVRVVCHLARNPAHNRRHPHAPKYIRVCVPVKPPVHHAPGHHDR